MRRLISYFVTSESEMGRDPWQHYTYLVIVGVFLILPFFLGFEPGAGNRVMIGSCRLPYTCMTRQVFGVNCPGCGLTRSFVLLTHGRARESFTAHRVGPLLYLFFVVQVFFRVHCLRNIGRPLSRRWLWVQRWFPLSVIVLLILNWVVGSFG